LEKRHTFAVQSPPYKNPSAAGFSYMSDHCKDCGKVDTLVYHASKKKAVGTKTKEEM